MMPCEGGTSKIGNSPGGRILEISETHLRHCADPQESSTHRNPPFRKNSRSRWASSVENSPEPALVSVFRPL